MIITPLKDKGFYLNIYEDYYSDIGRVLYISTDTVQCDPGTYSASGIKPCRSCRYGTYQPSYGRTQCLSCGPGITTDTQGATSFSHCLVKGECTQLIASAMAYVRQQYNTQITLKQGNSKLKQCRVGLCCYLFHAQIFN